MIMIKMMSYLIIYTASSSHKIATLLTTNLFNNSNLNHPFSNNHHLDNNNHPPINTNSNNKK